MKKIITEAEVIAKFKNGEKIIAVGDSDIITPLAKDKIKEFGITVVKKSVSDKIEFTSSPGFSTNKVTNSVALGGDHTGYTVKNLLSKILVEKGFSVQDVGTYDEKSCDYPDFAFAVAKKVKNGEVDFGILVDATGIPSAITANKIKGIRAATCYNEFTAKSAREHNNANILVIGAKALGEETIKGILETWLITKFGGERHQRRLDKITEIENQNL
ncbi:MAG: ribose 5-phosphate isomerase B [Ignavibacteriaceae bacterium]|jgi:ribose 5-phosphate isomerase B